jgi:DNA-binding MurR/RpiR family transcriptional regulator
MLTSEIISVILGLEGFAVNDRRILLQIKKTLPSLPEQEQKVADYILKHPRDVVAHSISRLADVSGVSNTTVSRFCQRMGATGYRDLRIALAKEWGSPENLIYVDAQPNDTLADVASKIFAANIQALRETHESLDLVVLEQFVDTLLEARRVDIYGIGGAGITAREMHFKCIQLGMNANVFMDGQLQVMSAAALRQGDVGIGISHTGLQREVVEALQLARSAGATTLALTSYPDTPVARAAEITLYTTSLAAAATYDSPSVRTAQLAVVDVLYEAMLLKGREAVQTNMARVAQAISEHTTGPGL